MCTHDEYKSAIIYKDGKYIYYDKQGDVIHEGDIVKLSDGNIYEVCSVEGQYLGVYFKDPKIIRLDMIVQHKVGLNAFELDDMKDIYIYKRGGAK